MALFRMSSWRRREPDLVLLLIITVTRAVSIDDFIADNEKHSLLSNRANPISPLTVVPGRGITGYSFPTSATQNQQQINALLKFDSLPNLSSTELESLLYQSVQPYSRYNPNLVQPNERINVLPFELPEQQLPDAPGQRVELSFKFPESKIDNQLNNTREIHNFITQRRKTNVKAQIVRRYQKTLNINTIYNTNIQRVNHRRLVNTIVSTRQDIQQPTVLVKYTRQQQHHEFVRDEPTQVVVEQGAPDVLPPLTLPPSVVTVGKLDAPQVPLPQIPTVESTDLPPVLPFSNPNLTDDRIRGFVDNPGFDTQDLARQGFDADRARRDPTYIVPQTVWDNYKALFDKQYFDGEEEQTRRRILTENLVDINDHNDRYRAGLETYTLAANQFSDQTTDEFNLLYNGSRAPKAGGDNGTRYCGMHVKSNMTLPVNVNWPAQKVVSPIQRQDEPRKCGACWAFSAAGAVESQLAIRRRTDPVVLSKQNLIDCSTTEGNNGCVSGLMNLAFEHIIKSCGIAEEAAYRYEARDGKCRFKPQAAAALLKSCRNIPFGDEMALDDAIANVGPVSVVFDANHPDFRSYKNGIFAPTNCTLNYTHGMLAVGYGRFRNGTEYYLLKNSWGQFWGVDGYGLVSRHRNNKCAIASLASYPIV